MRVVFMEMFLFDQLLAGTERLYTTVPVVLLTIYEDLPLTNTLQSRILGHDLYKCVLLILGILRAFTRFLAYFFHFDPPTFDAFCDAARVYLDAETIVLEQLVARLEGEKCLLVSKNEKLSTRLLAVESRSRTLQVSLAQEEQASCQLLLSMLACRRSACSRASATQSLRPQPLSADLNVEKVTKRQTAAKHPLDNHIRGPLSHRRLFQLVVSRRSACFADISVARRLLIELLTTRRLARERVTVTASATADGHRQVSEIYQHISQHLLVALLVFRRSARRTNNLLVTVSSTAENHQNATRSYKKISQHLLVELLTTRRQARALHAENATKSRLPIILTRRHSDEMQRREVEHERTTAVLLTQMLTFRSQLSHHLLPCGSLTSEPALRTLSAATARDDVILNPLIAQVEALRVSEAQARAEKDSMAKSLSDVLASLPIRVKDTILLRDESIRELVLALAFTREMLRDRRAAIRGQQGGKMLGKDGEESPTSSVEERTKTFLHTHSPDSVRAQAPKRGPPVNTSAIPARDAVGDRHNVADDAFIPGNFTESQGCAAKILDELNPSHQPQFPPGIPLPLHSMLLPSLKHVPETSGAGIYRSFPNPIRPPSPLIMSRGGAAPPEPTTGFRFGFGGQVHDVPALGRLDS